MAVKKYTVADGDTLSSIAARYNLDPASILSANNLTNGDTLYSGTELLLPDAAQTEAFPGLSATLPSYTSPDVSAAASAAEALKKIEAAMPGYTASEALKKAEELLAQWEQNKPGDYVSAYEDEIAALIDAIGNRPSFSYDPGGDALYNLYRQQYERQGRMAMLETAANAASLSGGYANSYAVTAGNQAYQNYLANLGNILPALYEQAYGRWKDEGEALEKQLALYRDMDEEAYGHWRDDVTDYYEDLSYYYNRYSDMSRAEYEAYQNNLAAWQADRDYWYKKAQDEQAQANWLAEFNLAQRKAASSGGGGGGSSRSGGGSSSSSSKSSGYSANYTTFLNGLKENVRIQVLRGKSKTSIYSLINSQVNEFLSNDFITADEAKQMRAVAQSYYATEYQKRIGK